MAIRKPGENLSDAEVKALNKEIESFSNLAQEMVSKLGVAGDLTKTFMANMKEVRNLTDETGTALNGLTRQEKKSLKFREESVDLTKEVLQNVKNIGTEEFRSFNISTKLARARREGGKELIKQLEITKGISDEQDRQHKLINEQANILGKPFQALDSMIKQIPIIGDLLSASLGLDDMAKDMMNTFKATTAQKLMGKQEVDVTPNVGDVVLEDKEINVATVVDDSTIDVTANRVENVPIDPQTVNVATVAEDTSVNLTPKVEDLNIPPQTVNVATVVDDATVNVIPNRVENVPIDPQKVDVAAVVEDTSFNAVANTVENGDVPIANQTVAASVEDTSFNAVPNTVENVPFAQQTIDVAASVGDDVNVPIDQRGMEKSIINGMNKASTVGGESVASSLYMNSYQGMVEGGTSGAIEAASNLKTSNPFMKGGIFSWVGKVKDFFIEPKVKPGDELQPQEQAFEAISADLLKVKNIETEQKPTADVEKGNIEEKKKGLIGFGREQEREQPLNVETESIAVEEEEVKITPNIEGAILDEAGKNNIRDQIEEHATGFATSVEGVKYPIHPDAQKSAQKKLGIFKETEGIAENLNNVEKDNTKEAGSFISRLKAGPVIGGAIAASLFLVFNRLKGVSDELGTGIGQMASFASLINPDAVTAFAKEFGTVENLTTGSALNLKLMELRFNTSAESAAKLAKAMGNISSQSTSAIIKDMIKFQEQLRKSGVVAPKQVMEDIAANTELFAKFGKDGGKNIMDAAVAAAKLGISLGDVAGTAEGLLDFESSIEKQMQAEILLGRQLNLDKARQLSFEGDLVGLGEELVRLAGSEAEWNDLNYVQKIAMADALQMNVEKVNSMIGAQERLNKIANQSPLQHMGDWLKAAVSNAAAMLPILLAVAAATYSILPGLVSMIPILGEMVGPYMWRKVAVNVAKTVGAAGAGFLAGTALQKGLEYTTAATGMDEVVAEPTMILAGEAGREHVGITPMKGSGPPKSPEVTVVNADTSKTEALSGEMVTLLKGILAVNEKLVKDGKILKERNDYWQSKNIRTIEGLKLA